MKKAISILIALASFGSILFLSGCATDPDESTIPWSRPHDWEGGIPGLGGNG